MSSNLTLSIPADRVSVALAAFPAKLDISAARGMAVIFAAIADDWAKLYIYNAANESLPISVQRWSAAEQSAQVVVLVNIPDPAAETSFALVFGTDLADNPLIGEEGSATGSAAYDADTLATWAMCQDPSTGGTPIIDGKGLYHGTPNGSMTSGDLVDHVLGLGWEFDGVDDWGSLPALPALTTWTMAATITPLDTTSGDGILVINGSGLVLANGYLAGLQGSNVVRRGSAVVYGVPVRLVITWDGSAMAVYEAGSVTGAALTNAGWGLSGVYRIASGYLARKPSMVVSDLSVSPIVRTAGWIAADYLAITGGLFGSAVSPVLVVRAELIQPWGIKTGADLIQPWGNAPQVRAALYQPWGEALAARAELVQPWGEALAARAELVQPWGDASAARGILEQPWGEASAARAELVQPWASSFSQRAELVQPWASSFHQRAELSQEWHIFGVIMAELDQPWAITEGLVRGELHQGWDLRERDLLRAELVQPWAIEADGTDVAGEGSDGVMRYVVVVRVGGTAVGIDQLNIEGGTDGDTITCEIQIGSEDDYLLCAIGAALEVTITSVDGTDDFVFVITDARIAEEHGKTTYAVEAESPGVLLGDSYADPVDGELSGMASAIAASLAGAVPLVWQAVDWEIPPATWIAAGDTPLALIKTLAASVGAVLQSLPDGSLLVVPEYEVPINQLSTVIPGLSLVENLDCFTTGSDPDFKSGYNRYLVGNQQASADTLSLEETEISADLKEVRGYQTPWNGAFTLTHTGGDWVAIEPMGVEERQETETVEFVAGAGKVKYPLYAVSAIEWQQTNLGSITTSEGGSLSAAIDQQSLLTITYTTRCLLWRVRDPEHEQLQLVAEL